MCTSKQVLNHSTLLKGTDRDQAFCEGAGISHSFCPRTIYWRRPLMRVLQSCDGPCSLWVCSIFSGHFTNQLSASDAELDNSKLFFAGLGICSSVFWANCSFFAKKWANELFAQKNERFAHWLIFGEWPELFAYIAHFWWATWAICSHRSPKKREWANCSFFKLTNLQYTKHTKK